MAGILPRARRPALNGSRLASRPLVSVVVVTWNGLHLLRPCAEALGDQTLPHQLVVVDNGSTDGTVEWVRSTLPNATLVMLPRNLGFAGGNNAGLRAAAGDLLVLVNNDTLPPPHFLTEITGPMGAAPDIGATGGVLTFAHRPDLIASAGIVVGHDGVHRDDRMLAPVRSLPNHAAEIFGATGGAVCLRREALQDVGFFAERFFNYLEDADLAWRLRLRGWRCLLAPGAQVPHVYSATSGHHSPGKQRLLALNRWRVLIRCFPSPLWRRCAPLIARYDLLALGYGLLTRNLPILHGRLQALRELPLLRRERRALAARATVAPETLEQWLQPAQSIGQVMHEARNLDRVLKDRRH